MRQLEFRPFYCTKLAYRNMLKEHMHVHAEVNSEQFQRPIYILVLIKQVKLGESARLYAQLGCNDTDRSTFYVRRDLHCQLHVLVSTAMIVNMLLWRQ